MPLTYYDFFKYTRVGLKTKHCIVIIIIMQCFKYRNNFAYSM